MSLNTVIIATARASIWEYDFISFHMNVCETSIFYTPVFNCIVFVFISVCGMPKIYCFPIQNVLNADHCMYRCVIIIEQPKGAINIVENSFIAKSYAI